jgi:hypothetical protein
MISILYLWQFTAVLVVNYVLVIVAFLGFDVGQHLK